MRLKSCARCHDRKSFVSSLEIDWPQLAKSMITVLDLVLRAFLLKITKVVRTG